MDELKASGKPFRISKQEVWDAWLKVKGNQGAPGVDGQSIEAFEADLKNNLYRIWNRMSSGTYFPPPVMAVEIPKPHGGGTRVLGVPCVADRIAQTVAAARLEEAAEPVFHPDSYGYRPGRSQLDAAGACRERCWEYNWVIDLDIRKFFDSVRWDLIVKAVEAHTSHETRWVVLYVKRWLAAALQLPDGTLQERDRGTPQGSAITPPTQKATSASRSRWVTGVWSAAGERRGAGRAAGVGSGRVRAAGGTGRDPGRRAGRRWAGGRGTGGSRAGWPGWTRRRCWRLPRGSRGRGLRGGAGERADGAGCRHLPAIGRYL